MRAAGCFVMVVVCITLAGCSSTVHGSQIQDLIDSRASGALLGAGAGGFGNDVAVHGGVAVIGAFLEGPDRTGAAYVYRFAGGVWRVQHRLEPANPVQDGFFGGKVAVSDGWIAVTARNEGAVYLYREIGEDWELVERIAPKNSVPNNRFGAGLALGGDRLAFNLHTDLGRGAEAGEVVYLYDLTAAGADLRHVFQEESTRVDTMFGGSIAMADDVLAIGASNYKHSPRGSGAVYLYDLNEEVPVLTQQLLVPADLGAHRFGASLALDQGLLAVGSPGEDYGGYRSGPVVLFERVGADWKAITTLRPNRSADNDHFGTDLVFIGSDLLIGGHTDNDLETGSTYALHFRRIEDRWVEAPRPLVSSSTDALRFTSVASDGQVLLVSIPPRSGVGRVESFVLTRSPR